MTAIILVLKGRERAPALLQPTSVTCDSGLQIHVYSGPLPLLPPGRLLTMYRPGLVFSTETPFLLTIQHFL